jgi:hypothetical protein
LLSPAQADFSVDSMLGQHFLCLLFATSFVSDQAGRCTAEARNGLERAVVVRLALAWVGLRSCAGFLCPIETNQDISPKSCIVDDNARASRRF